LSAGREYRLYGLTLQSPFALQCPRADYRDRPDVRLSAGSISHFLRARAQGPPDRDPGDWFHGHELADGSIYLQWTGLFEFVVSPDGRRILYRRLERASDESFKVYLLGQVLSFSLLAMGFEPLHGTAVVVEGGAVVFLGNCGYGKSTLGAALLARGFPILTDDLVVLQQHKHRWAVHRGIPRVKLFPSMARRLLGSHLRGTPMNDGTSKLVLPLEAEAMAPATVPLKALYVLSDPELHQRNGRITVEPLTNSEAFLEVVRASFNLIRVDRPRLANQFAAAGRLASSVPVRRLTYPRRFSALRAVCDAVLADALG
jgi:hypothetical protein